MIVDFFVGITHAYYEAIATRPSGRSAPGAAGDQHAPEWVLVDLVGGIIKSLIKIEKSKRMMCYNCTALDNIAIAITKL